MATDTPQRSNSGRNLAEVARDASRDAIEVVRDVSREAIGAVAGSEPALLANPVAVQDVSSKEFYEHVPIEAIIQELRTSGSGGLSAEAARERLKEEGLNELEKPKRPGIIKLFIAQLMNLIIVLLIIAAIASFAVGSAPSGAAILVIVILNAGIAAFTENQAGNALEALSNMSQPNTQVMRGGVEETIPSSTIVRGDLVLLNTGDVIAADMRLLDSSDLKVDEMPLTGESEDVSKHAKPKSMDTGKLTPEHMVFSGCSVTSGTARGIVVATGMRTRVGTIAGLLAGTKKVGRCGGFLPDTTAGMTPLQASLQRLGMIIGALAIVVCIIVFLVGLFLKTENPNDAEMPGWMYMVLVAITLTVAAIPEGIPLCVTISLSSGCSTMVRRNVLVRRIAAVETLGSASVICSDKTGTLTEGKMRAVKMWASGTNYEISGKGFDPTSGTITRAEGGASASQDKGVRSTLLTALLCSNAKVEKETTEEGETRWAPSGNSSEVPIVVAAGKVGIWASELQEAFPRKVEVPFSSSRKMMLTVCGTSSSKIGEGGVDVPQGTSALACVKGAPNYVLDACSTWVGEDGSVVQFTEDAKQDAIRTIDNLSSQALRVLAIAVRPLAEIPFSADEDSSADEKMGVLCQDLTLLGLIASIDPPRAGVRQAVQDANSGHIRVMMITGDYLKTAAAIARDVGILEEGAGENGALDCTSLRPSGEYLPDNKIDDLTKDARVFARAKPEDKLEIVKSLQRQGLVSAMTGDGVNDAPALNAADIGVAMGIQGTEVAKGASAMILTDDNFVSIVGAVEKGRVIYAGIQKFVAFIMSVHIAEVLQIFVCIVAKFPVMRTPLQILYLILVTDLAPSIALGLEPGQAGIMNDHPRPKQQPILLAWMWISTVANSVILTIIILGVYVWGLKFYCGGTTDVMEIATAIRAGGDDDTTISEGLKRAQTAAFISLVWSENIRAYTSRSFESPVCFELCTNSFMQKAIGIAQAALYLAIFLPGLSDILGLRGADIGYEGWIAAAVGAVACLACCEAYKVLQRTIRLLLGGPRATPGSKAAFKAGAEKAAAEAMADSSPGATRRAATAVEGREPEVIPETRRCASV